MAQLHLWDNFGLEKKRKILTPCDGLGLVVRIFGRMFKSFSIFKNLVEEGTGDFFGEAGCECGSSIQTGVLGFCPSRLATVLWVWRPSL